MNKDMLCTEQEIALLVNTFYARVTQDSLIGPIFDRHIQDWPAHLNKMVDFWSSTLRGTARFRGMPMGHAQSLGRHHPRALSTLACAVSANHPRLGQRRSARTRQ